MGFISKDVREETDEKIKRLKREIEKEGRRKAELDIIDDGVEKVAEDMGIRFEDEKEDDFMDVFK
jgi:molybdopterin biosynthesis enzyme MoaB